MGNKIIKTDNIERYGIVSFLCDTEADISKIDINNYNSGCRIYCIENKKNYILDSNKEWKETEAEDVENLTALVEQLTDKVNSLSKKVIYRADI